jgi:uncharacterized phage protein (TIGR02218 family)
MPDISLDTFYLNIGSPELSAADNTIALKAFELTLEMQSIVKSSSIELETFYLNLGLVQPYLAEDVFDTSHIVVSDKPILIQQHIFSEVYDSFHTCFSSRPALIQLNLRDYLLTARELFMAEIYIFTLKDRTQLLYTSLDDNIVYGGTTYSKFKIDRSSIKRVKGLEVDTLTLTVYPGVGDKIVNRNFIYSVMRGDLDNASLVLRRIFYTSWGGLEIGSKILFSGSVASVELDRTQVEIQVKSYIELLNISLPRKVYIPGCQNTLYDRVCTLNIDDYEFEGEVEGTQSTSNIIYCNLEQDDLYFDLGFLTFTSGDNDGETRTIRTYDKGMIRLIIPLEFIPSANDTFIIYPGCDKRRDTCSEKYDNEDNYRGFPYIPQPEVVMYGGAGRTPTDIGTKK